jgi:type IV secretion system protein VirB6
MIPACTAPPPTAGFLEGLLSYVDCQAQSIGANGYEALAQPGSTLSLLITGFLTLFIAFMGYRMLFGQTPSLREGVLAMVKIGIVLALATSWGAYRTLVYDVALRGPAELASTVGQQAGLPGAGAGLVERLGYADRNFVQLEVLGPGQANVVPGQTPVDAFGRPVAPPSQFDGFAMGGSRILFLTGAIGGLAATRLVAGFLLALGPLFIAFLLFEGTRGLFVGWLRALAAMALGALGIAITLGVELILIEMKLAELITLRNANLPIPGAAIELFVITLIFTLVMLAMLYAAARVALGFRLPEGWRALPARVAGSLRAREEQLAGVPQQRRAAPAEDRSRAAQVADAVAATQRRETGGWQGAPALAAATVAGAPSRRVAPAGGEREPQPAAAMPIGQSYRRRTRGRVSARAGRRDSGS